MISDRIRLTPRILIRPSSFLAFQQNSVGSLSNPKDPIKLLSKYYGKKVTTITKKSDLDRIYKRSKHFDKLMIQNEVKLVRRQSISYIQYCAPPIRKDNFLFVRDIYVSEKYLKTKNLIVPSTRSLCSYLINKVGVVRHLALKLGHNQTSYFRYILSLRALERLDIIIFNNKRPAMKENVLIEFFSQLFQVKEPKVLNLDLSDYSMSFEFIRKIMQLFDEAKIHKWQLNLKLDSKTLPNVQNLGKLLSKIDFLGIIGISFRHTTPEDELHSYHRHAECGYSREKLQEFSSKQRKVLNLHFEFKGLDTRAKVDLEPILESCWSLESLYVSVTAEDLELETWEKCEDGGEQQSRALWTKNLKRLVLNSKNDRRFEGYENNKKDQGKVNRNRNQPHDAEKKFSAILKVLRAENCNLEFLRLFSCQNYLYYAEEESRAVHNIQYFPDELKAVTTLKHIDLTFNGKIDAKCLEDVFSSLQNLEKLDLTFCHSELYDWDIDFPFQSLKNLSHLKLNIQRNHKTEYQPGQSPWEPNDKWWSEFEDPMEWGKSFTNRARELTKLQVLELSDNNTYGMDQKIFFDILHACHQFQKLKKLGVNIRVIKPEEKESTAITRPSWMTLKPPIANQEDIYGKIKNLVDNHSTLEEVDFRGIKIYRIKN